MHKPIKDIPFNTPSTIIGIIYKFLPTTSTKGIDNLTTINIIDEYGDKLCIRIFSQFNIYQDYFGYKDIVIIKGVRINRDRRNKKIIGYLKDDGKAEIINKFNLVTNSYTDNSLDKENLYEKLLEQFKKNFPNSVINNLTLKSKKIIELQENLFFDFKGICINISNNFNGELKYSSADFIDGTSNERISNELIFDNYKKCEILKIIFWDQIKFNSLQIGKTYLLKNLRIKEIGLMLIANFSENNIYDILQVPDNNIVYNDLIKPFNSDLKIIKRKYLNEFQMGYNFISLFYDQEIKESFYEVCTSCKSYKSPNCNNSCKIIIQQFINLLFEDETMKLYVICNKKSIKDILNKRISRNKKEHEIIIKKGLNINNEIYYVITDVII